MTAPPTASAVPHYFTAFSASLALTQSSQQQIDDTAQQEMARLLNGGTRTDHSSDFILYVVLPLMICIGFIMLLRRMMP